MMCVFWQTLRVGNLYLRLCIEMGCADHLGKVDHDGLARFSANQDVEFVEVSVDQTCARKADDEVHQVRVQLARRGEFGDLASG